MSWDAYEAVAHQLRDRILALIPENPSILEMESCWDLFKVPGFSCDDLGPSGAQAGWALGNAKARWAADHGETRSRTTISNN